MAGGSVSLSGDDVLQIAGRVLANFADGDVALLKFEEDLAVVKAGKDGNTIFASKEAGRVATLDIRVLLGSKDDQFLNSLMQSQQADFSSFVLMDGFFTKRIGDGKSKITSKIYQCSGGIFSRRPDAKNNVDGDTEQSVAVYHMKFGNSSILIQ